MVEEDDLTRYVERAPVPSEEAEVQTVCIGVSRTARRPAEQLPARRNALTGSSTCSITWPMRMRSMLPDGRDRP